MSAQRLINTICRCNLTDDVEVQCVTEWVTCREPAARMTCAIFFPEARTHLLIADNALPFAAKLHSF